VLSFFEEYDIPELCVSRNGIAADGGRDQQALLMIFSLATPTVPPLPSYP